MNRMIPGSREKASKWELALARGWTEFDPWYAYGPLNHVMGDGAQTQK